MLLQSHAGYIHLLPALPEEWKTGSVTGLKARGGFVVDMQWENGKVLTATIHSLAGKACRVKYGDQIKVLRINKDESATVEF